ncbi:unnamed protein product [Brugia pahangi]|uniref:Suppressor protein SRP40-like n=1 Tax=Brugia pahangi TaxID=6280 RepID=A0A0N4T849_BRUPA|nr:unnamed protein product [Brugia pahangi]
MSETKRQVALRRGGANRAKRGVKLSKPIRDRVACRDESPEIRSVRKGRIRLGSVAPLLSRRAKALAMKTHYSHYSDDEDSDDSCTGDGEEENEEDEEKDNDEEFYDYDQNHRSYNHRRTPSYHVRCMKDYVEDYDDQLVSSTSKHNRTQIKKKKKISKTRKATTATPTISNRTKSLTNGKAKKITARCKSKKTKAVHNEETIPSGPITRSRRALMMTMNDY